MADIGIRVVVQGVAEARRNIGAINTDLNNLNKTIGTLSGASSTLGTSLTRIGTAMIGVGRTLTIAVTAPIAAAGTAAIEAGINFEEAFADIGKTVDGVADSTGQLTDLGRTIRDEFRQMALEVPIATDELARLGGVVGQLGVQADDVAEVTRTIAMLGATTELSAEDAAKGLIRFNNIINGSTEGIEDFLKRAGSAIVALGNASVSTEGEILDLTLRLAAAGDKANFSAQEILAWATTLSDLGVRAEAGGSAVSRAITEMVFAVQTGSDNLGTFASVTDQTVDEFVQAFEQDASGALLNFISSLQEGIAAGTVTKDVLNDLGLSGVRAIDILGRLGNAEKIFTKNLNTANTEWERALALQEEFNKRAATVQSMIQILKNRFGDLAITIFDLVRDDLIALIEGIGNLVDRFKNLDPATQKTIITLLAMAAAIGPILIVVGGLIAGLGAVVTGLVALVSPAGLAAAAIGGIGLALGALIAPAIIENLGTIKEMALDVAEALGFIKITPFDATAAAAGQHGAPVPETPTTSFQMPTLDSFLKGLKELGGSDVANAIESLKIIGDSIGDIFSGLSDSDRVKDAFDSIGKSLSKVGDVLKTTVLKGLNQLADWLSENEDEIVTLGEGLAESAAQLIKFGEALAIAVSPIVLGGLTLLGEGLTLLFDILTGDWEGALETLRGIPDVVADVRASIGEGLLEAGTGLVGSTPEEFKSVWAGILDNATIALNELQGIVGAKIGEIVGIVSNSFLTMTSVIHGSIAGAVVAATAWITGVAGGIASGIGGVIGSVTGMMTSAVASVLGSVAAAGAAASLWISAVQTGVASKVAAVVGLVTGMVATAVGAMQAAVGEFAAAGAAMIAGAVAGILGGIGALVAAAVSAATAASEAFAGALQIGSPSKVTMGYGENFMEGIIEGIQNLLSPTISTVTDVAGVMSSALGAVNNVASPTNSTVNNVRTNSFQFGDFNGVPVSSPSDLVDILADRINLAGAGAA